jgi:hypothetical protein
VRIFAEYLGQRGFRNEKPSWNPREDRVVGFDIWREYGAAAPRPASYPGTLWAELFLGAVYHSTAFYQSDYNGIQWGGNLKLGTAHGRRELPLMPYVMLDINGTSEYNYFWQNRLIVGLGLRIQKRTGADSAIKLWAECDTIS